MQPNIGLDFTSINFLKCFLKSRLQYSSSSEEEKGEQSISAAKSKEADNYSKR
jgi:hypothetical protein